VLVAEARPRPYASGVVAHGWNIDEEPLRAVLEASTPASPSGGAGWNAEGAGVVACRAHCWVLRQPATGSGSVTRCLLALGFGLVRAGGVGRVRVLEGRVFLD